VSHGPARVPRRARHRLLGRRSALGRPGPAACRCRQVPATRQAVRLRTPLPIFAEQALRPPSRTPVAASRPRTHAMRPRPPTNTAHPDRERDHTLRSELRWRRDRSPVAQRCRDRADASLRRFIFA